MGLTCKVSFLLTIAFLITLQVSGQRLVGGAGMVNAGVMSSRIVTSTIKENFPDAVTKNAYALIGGEGYYRHDKAIMLVSGFLGVRGDQAEGQNTLQSSLWAAQGGFGWIVAKNSRLSFYPAVAVGMNGYSLVEYRQSPDIDLERVKIKSTSIDVSLHFDYMMMDINAQDNTVNGIILGIKTGYNAGVMSSTHIQGWYATVSVGGLMFMKKKS